MTPEERKRELPGVIVRWYEIEEGTRVGCLVTAQGNSTLAAEALEEKGLEVTRLPLDMVTENITDTGSLCEKGGYDVIVMVDILEYAGMPTGILQMARQLLKQNGKLLIATDNRLGIRYFCGDQDPFSGKNYDGIENYRHVRPWERKAMQGRAYSKAEIIQFLENAGFSKHHFFSVFPRISNPQLLLAEEYVPNEALDIRVFPEYNNPDTVFLMEEELYPALMENGLLHGMANGFFIECPLEGEFMPINQVTLSGERGKQNAMATIIGSGGFVEKRALYREGEKKLHNLAESNAYLKAHGVGMIGAEIRGETFLMPYVDGTPANEYFRRLLESDKVTFLRELDIFWEIIQSSSEPVVRDEVDWEKFEPGWEKRKKDDPNKDKWKHIVYGSEEEREKLGVILKRGYLDLVSLNCFRKGDSFIFYDQELYLKNVPAKAIMVRTIEFIYKFNDQLDEILPRRELLERYELSEYMGLYQKFIKDFLNTLREDDGLSDYFKEGRREGKKIVENRRRMNYSEEEYRTIFKDIFYQTKGRKLYLFGSGRYAKRFIDKYGADYPVSGYLDNDEKRWGTEVNGLPVLSPKALKEMNPAEYKVMICIRDYMPVIKQLRREAVPNFSVYDPYDSYRNVVSAGENVTLEGKQQRKYNIGYVAGVFDLFHIGHLNLLRRAKEQCNYLIVGIVTDEGVVRHKKSNPKIPYEERVEIVCACRYVDEVVEIPLDQGDTDEAWRRYRFDVQFSGSDYADDPKWMAKRDFLQRHGADLVFFPYTEGISTTQLKDVVDRKD